MREAQHELTAHLREHPEDVVQRTFLFELLCFSGDYDRAEKQLAVLSQGSSETQMGALVYRCALHAEKMRHQVCMNQEFPSDARTEMIGGILNDHPFKKLTDADPDLGARLEVFAAGACLWIPFEHIAYLEMAPPRRLRDTLWIPASVRTGPAFRGKDLGEVLIPAIYPFSWKHPDEAVWLGRVTNWISDDEGKQYPVGQRTLLLDGEEVPFLEVRSIEFSAAQKPASIAS